MSSLGIVTIGRNEGERLRHCLLSLIRARVLVVYVDSNSSDGSAELARSLGVEVVELDTSRPVGVPRARNEGAARLCEINPEIRFIQFIDGDCELVDGWLEHAAEALENRPDAALVTGRRRERFPTRSIYNRLAGLEWDMPLGEIQSSHGDILIRAEAFHEVGGFNPAFLVSEDFELCLRLRKAGWILLRIDFEMSIHDMAMTQFRQWWWRNVRTGYGYADGLMLHGKSPERFCVREVRGILFWGVALPAVSLVLAWPTRGISLVLLAAYLYLYLRIRQYALRRGWSAADARVFGFWCILGKFPNAWGLFTYWIRQFTRKERRIIEYKGAGASPSHQVQHHNR